MPHVLWPQVRWIDDMAPELWGLDGGAEPWFETSIESVTSEQWRTCDGIIGYGQYPEQTIHMLENCRILVLPAVGFNTVDIELWSSLGIAVCNTPDYGTREVADHALALMLTLSKGIAFHDEALREDPVANWRPALNPFGQRLSKQTFGVLGLGRIGPATALRAKSFDMDVVFFDPYIPNGTEQALGIRRVTKIEELFNQSDVLSIHTPLTDETYKLVNADLLSNAKEGMLLINTARGPIIDDKALYDAMKNDIVLAAGLDVLPKEPANPESPLINAWASNEEWIKHRLVITPHSAFCTPQSMFDMRGLAARTAVRYLRDNVLENCVNASLLAHRR